MLPINERLQTNKRRLLLRVSRDTPVRTCQGCFSRSPPLAPAMQIVSRCKLRSLLFTKSVSNQSPFALERNCESSFNRGWKVLAQHAPLPRRRERFELTEAESSSHFRVVYVGPESDWNQQAAKPRESCKRSEPCFVFSLITLSIFERENLKGILLTSLILTVPCGWWMS